MSSAVYPYTSIQADRVCQTCANCTGLKCVQPAVLGVRLEPLLELGLGIRTAYRLCKGEHWKEQEWEE